MMTDPDERIINRAKIARFEAEVERLREKLTETDTELDDMRESRKDVLARLHRIEEAARVIARKEAAWVGASEIAALRAALGEEL